MREMGAAATTLTEVVQLLQLYPVMPASVATAERSFSTLRRMKTYIGLLVVNYDSSALKRSHDAERALLTC